MLDHLRKHSKSWVIKFILGFMTVGLILFFGYSGLEKSSKGESYGNHAPIVEVNGESITEGQFQQAYEAQLKFYEQIAKGNITPALSQNIKTGTLKKLIDTLLMSQEARSIGLNVSNKELVHEITSNPNFHKEGVFNKKFYLDQFKPYYERTNGMDYEASLKEEILADKFETFIRNSVSVSIEEMKREFILSNTDLNLQKIYITAKAESNNSESQATSQIETEILKALSEPNSPAKGNKKTVSALETLIKKYNLKTEESSFHSLRDKVAFTGDPSANEAFECILNLNQNQSFCPKAYAVGDQKIIFKLITRREADIEKFEPEKANIEKTLMSRRQSLILQQITNAISKQAKIDSNLKPSS